ncbi:MAG TPA: DUF433 domain-containing protein [Candidatus Nanoarchaeia archaeon]|nr:DUF433 domain-containing protein [Candidatus Nanoarchaeia archaeon]
MRIQVDQHIVMDTEICHGTPTFTGTRIMVWQVLELLEAGRTPAEIIRQFPSLSKAHIRAALRYATELARGKANVILSPVAA